ncbi:hypothetical protein IW146_001881 [Coemansia sp. RSA 922]|nr:hypothetical protein H4S04_009067 [Coemansia sp. S16]KAJ2041065.1 hypothetical protein GGI08_007985 [Coemansia sp. S2]KAJ2115986.1 hypothetical protein IW146_001881 [Coemansia sp. RSA 922]KAJ2341959.1 hypothetical protein GGH92_005582 [Coemansia sp. RSA 2673]
MSDDIQTRLRDIELRLAIMSGTFERPGLPVGVELYVPAATIQPHQSTSLPDDKRKEIVNSFPTIKGLQYKSPPMPLVLRDLTPALAQQDKILRDIRARFADVLRPVLELVCRLPEAEEAGGFPTDDTCAILEATLLLLHDGLSHIDQLRRQ